MEKQIQDRAENSNILHEKASLDEKTFPVIEEEVIIEKKLTETGKVRISKKVVEENKRVEVSSFSEEVDVDHVQVNKYIDKIPEVRYEGDKMIIPVVKEVVVIEKRLLLVEELHVNKRKVETKVQQEIPIKREEVLVEREPAA
jgi:uncharacterized protein (TIGR02271 family)